MPNSILSKIKTPKQMIQWSFFILEHGFIYDHLVTHMHKLSSSVCHGALRLGGKWVMLRGRCGEHSPPGECWVPLSLAPAWSVIIYRRDKIKQTQQNAVKSKSCGSHIYKLSHIEMVAGDAHGAEFVQLLVPASQHPSASSSQVETLY